MNGRIIRPQEPTSLRLPRIGKIKVGEKTTAGYPRSLDYFVATGDYSSYFDAVYVKQNRITVVFISDDPNQSCRERMVYYNDQGKVCARGDGETYEVWNETASKYITITITERPALLEEIAGKWPTKYGWLHELTLNFLLPKVRSVMGFWQFTTRGKASSIPQIIGAFDTVMQVRKTVAFQPFDLVVNFAKSQHPGEASRFPVVTLVPNADPTNMAITEAFNQPQGFKQLGE